MEIHALIGIATIPKAIKANLIQYGSRVLGQVRSSDSVEFELKGERCLAYCDFCPDLW
jgi:hypothetical protein